MLFRQVIHEDLGCASYLIGDPSAGVAAVVDPQWDIDPYLRLSSLHDVRIGYVLETHNHADHVSGHGRLAGIAGASIHINAKADVEYPHEPFDDGWVLRIGEVEIEAIATPGHRPEHTSFLLRDRTRGDEPVAILTGDSLFIGDVARPDLAIDAEEGARQIFASISGRLLTLPPAVEVWPGHLGGSMCGGSALDHKSSSTIGFEADHNRFARFPDAESFVANALGKLGERPPNVEHVVALNRGPLIEEATTPAPLEPRSVERHLAAGAVLIDIRANEQFDEAHIPGALAACASATGFATKVAKVVPIDAELIVVGAGGDDHELEAAKLLAAVGLRVGSFLAGGMTAWRSEGRRVERLEMIEPAELADRLESGEVDGSPLVLDVRETSEWNDGHIPGSLSIPFGDLAERLEELPRNRPIATICSGGKRSGLAGSILQREGFEAVIHVGHGGVGTWQREGNPVDEG